MEKDLSVRQHWMALVRPNILMLIILSGLIFFAYKNPVLIVKWFGITKSMKGFEYVKFFYDHGIQLTLVPIAFAALSLFMAWSWWSISYFEVDGFALKYKLGPFMENQIPLRAIQDIRVSRGILGVMFGFGTIVVDAGREEESLNYVPDVENIVNALRPQRF